ncbi:MAG: helix-turn-helix transcriptional regulator [Treponema sp.]|jgi:transcriptional regulator with XRE-family HTH domain|nr:helix-turn-helix transcriptional regulator [Treponema sp.]
MTHFQELFIRNLRFYRKKKGISQQAFSEKISVSPNYLNAVENGKNFPSPEVIQAIISSLEILPYQLFLEECSASFSNDSSFSGDLKNTMVIQELTDIKQKLIKELDGVIGKIYC